MKKILFTLIMTMLLVSCSSDEDINLEETSSWTIKQNFLLDIKNINEFTSVADLVKSWKITSTQDINISSQVSWRVSSIYKKEWEFVSKWQKIVAISDNIANYGLKLESAKNNLEKAKLSYESTEVKLDKAIIDITRDIWNSEIDNVWSSSSLELQKIENTIKKLALDYDNLKIGNLEQIQGFKNSFNRDYNNFSIFVEDVIDFWDDLLWVSQDNKDKNDDYEDYLWRKDTQQLNNTKELLIDLMNYKKDKLSNINYNFEGTNEFDSNLKIITDWYEILDELLVELDEVFDNSITSVWNLSSAQLSWFKTQVSWYNTIFNWNNSWFVSLENWLNSFLETYLNTEESLLKQIELLEQDKRIFIKSLDYKIDVTNATLEEAKINRELTLKNLDIVITDANIWYKQALKQYNKLIISAPISWIISDINIDVGQEINAGSAIVSIVNNSDNLVEIWFTKEELAFVNNNDKAYVNYGWEVFEWYVYSISQSADANLKYKWKIKIKDKVNLLWSVVWVTIPVNVPNKLIPVNIVKIWSNDKWLVNTLSGSIIIQKEVKLWNIYNEKIELLDITDEDFTVILNYVDNYDSEKFNLKINDINE
jgi:hypothetical protein